MKNKKEIRKQMYANIQGYNKFLNSEHLDKLGWFELLANCHPIDRPVFQRELEQSKLIKF